MTAETQTLLAVFADIDPAAQAIDKLHDLGIHDEEMNVISGVPITHAMFGRPHTWTNVPRLALGGAVGGFVLGLFLSATPAMYPYYTGGQALIPVPPSIIVIFEMTMLIMLISTFLGVFLDSYFPSYTPKEYVAEISDGKIAVLFRCPAGDQKKISDALTRLGAESVKTAEAQQL